MHELVADDVVRVGQRSTKRQDDATAQRLGDAAGSFAELALIALVCSKSGCEA